MRFFKRRPIPVLPKKFRLVIDGVEIERFATYNEALDHSPEYKWDPETKAGTYVPEYHANYSIDEKIGNRWFNKAFGYKTGTTSTNDLAAMGVPIGVGSLSDRKL